MKHFLITCKDALKQRLLLQVGQGGVGGQLTTVCSML